MKKLHISLFAAFFLTILSCKKEVNQTVTIVRNCTGTYLRLEGKDYHVCNVEKVAAFPSGSTVVATFKKIRECKDPDMGAAMCMMYYPNEGWIRVDKIN